MALHLKEKKIPDGRIQLPDVGKKTHFDLPGLDVVGSGQGLRRILEIEHTEDGRVFVKLRMITDGPRTKSAKTEFIDPSKFQMAVLGSADATQIIEGRTLVFLNRYNEQADLTLDDIPDMFAVRAMVLDYDRNVDLGKRRGAIFESAWKDLPPEVKGSLKNAEFRTALATWERDYGVLIKDLGGAVTLDVSKFDIEKQALRELIRLVYARSGENLVSTGIISAANYAPHVNLGVEIDHALSSLRLPILIPHDVFVYVLNRGWNEAPGVVAGAGIPTKFSFGTYDDEISDEGGKKRAEQVTAFKRSGDLSDLGDLINKERLVQFISAHEKEQIVVVPVPSAKTGFPSESNIVLANHISKIIEEKLGIVPLSMSGEIRGPKGKKQVAQPHRYHRLGNASNLLDANVAESDRLRRGGLVILVDDVLATGATTEALKAVMLDAGADKVVTAALLESEIALSKKKGKAKSTTTHRLPDNSAFRGTAVPGKIKVRASDPISIAHYLDMAPTQRAELYNPNEIERADSEVERYKTLLTAYTFDTYVFLSTIHTDSGIETLLSKTQMQSRVPDDHPAKKFDVNFFVEMFNLWSESVGLKDKISLSEITPFERKLVSVIGEFERFGQPLGAYPNRLSGKSKQLIRSLKSQGLIGP